MRRDKMLITKELATEWLRVSENAKPNREILRRLQVQLTQGEPPADATIIWLSSEPLRHMLYDGSEYLYAIRNTGVCMTLEVLFGYHPHTSAESLPMDKIQIDKAYQRGPKQIIRDIDKAFIYEAFQRPLIGLRDDGTYWAVDGQQRILGVSARLRRGIVTFENNMIPVEVFKSMGRSHEANVFLAANNRATMQPLDQFKAALEGGEQIAVAVNRICTEKGLKIARSGRWPACGAVGRLMVIAKSHGGERRLSDILDIIISAWKGDDRALQDIFIFGLDWFLAAFQFCNASPDYTRLISVLAKAGPNSIERNIGTLLRGGGRGFGCAKVIAELYDANLRKHRIAIQCVEEYRNYHKQAD
jgi:hypothetical protein